MIVAVIGLLVLIVGVLFFIAAQVSNLVDEAKLMSDMAVREVVRRAKENGGG